MQWMPNRVSSAAGRDELDAGPYVADLGDDLLVAVAVEDDDCQLLDRQPLGLGDPPQVPVDRHLEVDHAASFAAHDQLLHVVDVGGEHGSPLGEGDHRDGAWQAGGGQARAFDGVDRNVNLWLEPVADLLAEEEHRGFVLLAFADDDGALHVDGRQRLADRLHRPPVGSLLVAATLQRGRGEGARLGHAQQLQREVAVDLGFFDHCGTVES